MRGRVVGVMTSMAYAAGPVGFMIAGPLVDAFGLRFAFLALALPVLVIALLCPWVPAFRELDANAPRMA
jgi:MFS family permease